MLILKFYTDDLAHKTKVLISLLPLSKTLPQSEYAAISSPPLRKKQKSKPISEKIRLK